MLLIQSSHLTLEAADHYTHNQGSDIIYHDIMPIVMDSAFGIAGMSIPIALGTALGSSLPPWGSQLHQIAAQAWESPWLQLIFL